MAYTVNGILQARILEWVIIPLPRASEPHLIKLCLFQMTLKFDQWHLFFFFLIKLFSNAEKKCKNQEKFLTINIHIII